MCRRLHDKVDERAERARATGSQLAIDARLRGTGCGVTSAWYWATALIKDAVMWAAAEFPLEVDQRRELVRRADGNRELASAQVCTRRHHVVLPHRLARIGR